MSLVEILGPAAIGAAGTLLGSGVSARQSQANAREQMDFQREMSNTAYQRAADDMEAAGLNRILAIGSPATTPGGAMGTVPDYGYSAVAGANAGIAGVATAQNIQQSQATIDKLVADTTLAGTKNMIELQKAAVWEKVGPILANAGEDFGVLLDIMSDPAVWQGVWDSIKEATQQQIQTLFQFMDESYQEFNQSWLGRSINEMIRIGE